MSDDFAKATARPGFVTIADTEYRVSKFGPRDLGDLQAWLKAQIPDPRLMARELCAGLSDTVALEIWRELSEEAKLWPPSVASSQGNEMLMLTYEGNVQLLTVALRRHNPGLDSAKIRAIAETISIDEIANVLSAGFPEDAFVPKAIPETATPEE